MSQRKNIGKIVVTIAPVASATASEDQRSSLGTRAAAAVAGADSNRLSIAADGAYLITGGLGGLGMQTARWLGGLGAGGVVLLARRAGETADQVQRELADIGCPVAVASGDVCDIASLNVAIDGFAAYRNGLGKRTLSINWGAFDGSGMAAQLGDMMRSQGVYLLPTQRSLALRRDFLEHGIERLIVFRANWDRFGTVLSNLMSGQLQFNLNDKLTDLDGGETPTADKQTLAIKEELATLNASEMRLRLQLFLAQQLSDIMGIAPEEIDTRASATTLGMDSLMAMELGNKMQTALGIEMPMSIYLQGSTIDRLADYVVQILSGSEATPPPAVADRGSRIANSKLSKNGHPLPRDHPSTRRNRHSSIGRRPRNVAHASVCARRPIRAIRCDRDR